MLTEMYSSPQYLSDDLKKIGHAYSDAHELQKVVNFKADISETIKDTELGFQI